MARLALASGMRWSAISIIGREGARMVSTVLVARFVGPEAFGTFAQAAVYMAIVGLLLDQGLATALIQRPNLERELPGAVLTANLAVGGSLAALTIALASTWAGFMRTPELTLVLVALAPSLVLRAACVTPRAMLIRRLDFRPIGAVEIVSAVVGGTAGVVAAVLGASYWALVVQIVTTDAMVLTAYLGLRIVPRPNLRLGRLREIAAFSGRAFASNILGTIAGNIDNLLVGRFQGPESLAFYSLGYRLLLLPIQLLGVTIGNVLFPAFSRLAGEIDSVRNELSRATRMLSTIVLPGMALVAATAPQTVILLFGDAWAPAVPIVQVLAVAGGAHAIYQTSIIPLMLGLGHAKLLLRYALLSNTIFVACVAAGVPFSPLAVAVGYGIATVLILPIQLFIAKRLVWLGIAEQARLLMPGAHVGLWIFAVYSLVSSILASGELVELAVATPVALGVGLGIFRMAHPRQLEELIFVAARIAGRDPGQEPDQPSLPSGGGATDDSGHG